MVFWVNIFPRPTLYDASFRSYQYFLVLSLLIHGIDLNVGYLEPIMSQLIWLLEIDLLFSSYSLDRIKSGPGWAIFSVDLSWTWLVLTQAPWIWWGYQLARVRGPLVVPAASKYSWPLATQQTQFIYICICSFQFCCFVRAPAYLRFVTMMWLWILNL